MTEPSDESTNWQNRIIGMGEEDVEQIVANPHNFRIHPTIQQVALTGSLETLGWIQTVIINKTTGNLIDGHLRVLLAMRKKVTKVPVTYIQITEEEEAQALLSLDPISALAATDHDKLAELFAMVETDNELVNNFLDDFKQREALFLNVPGPGDGGDGDGEQPGQRAFTFHVVVEDTDIWEDIVNAVRSIIDENKWKARIEA